MGRRVAEEAIRECVEREGGELVFFLLCFDFSILFLLFCFLLCFFCFHLFLFSLPFFGVSLHTHIHPMLFQQRLAIRAKLPLPTRITTRVLAHALARLAQHHTRLHAEHALHLLLQLLE